ncbi:hypothetical protein JCM10207_006003 [Rhodosporidiobolus poonsookiae]
MPPRRRYHIKKPPKPVFFGPEPPPPPQEPAAAAPPPASSSPTNAPTDTPDASAPVDGTPSTAQAPTEGQEGVKFEVKAGGGGQRRRKKLPRKKIEKGTGGGWLRDDELPLHEQDAGRYDPTLPWDLRLLRCCDEFRNLRSLGHGDRKVNYNHVLRFFQADIIELRDKYGPQPLRGYDPEHDREDESEDEEDPDDPNLDKKAEDLDEMGEEDWAKMVFNPSRLSKFFENRLTDGYAATVTLAPQMMTSFIKFQLTRNVFPAQVPWIEECLAVCEVASQQLVPAHTLYQHLLNKAQLSTCLRQLFPHAESTLAYPFAPDKASPDALFDEDDLHKDVEGASETWQGSSAATGSAGGGGEKGGGQKKGRGRHGKAPKAEHKVDDGSMPEKDGDEARRRAEQVAQQVKLDHETYEKWHAGAPSISALSSDFSDIVKRLGLVDESSEGSWRVAHRERSARPLNGWKLLSGTTAAAAADAKARGPIKKEDDKEKGKAKEERLLVQLAFGPHPDAFPLTTEVVEPPESTLQAVEKVRLKLPDHDLSSPLELKVDLAPSFPLEHLTALSSSVFEADLMQLDFVPSSSTSISNSPPPSLWLLSSLFRLVPAYWSNIKPDVLRHEPPSQMSFEHDEGGTTLEDVLARWKEDEEREAAAAAEANKPSGIEDIEEDEPPALVDGSGGDSEVAKVGGGEEKKAEA